MTNLDQQPIAIGGCLSSYYSNPWLHDFPGKSYPWDNRFHTMPRAALEYTMEPDKGAESHFALLHC